MTTTENSRADALTADEREVLEHTAGFLHATAATALRKLLAASPVEQPAAAPKAVGKIETFSGKHGLTWSVDPESLLAGTVLYAGVLPAAASIDDLRQEVLRLCRLFLDDEQGKYSAKAVVTRIFSLAATPTPSPEDERAAGLIEQHHRDSAELRRLCEARDEARRTAEYWKAEHNAANARIAELERASANETGAEGVTDTESEAERAYFKRWENEGSAALSSSPAMAAEAPEELPHWFEMFLTNVCELPDRNSPEGEPDAIVATLDELRNCALNAIEQCVSYAAPAQAAEPVAKIRVSHMGQHAELESYVSRSLPMGVHEVYAAPQHAQADARVGLTDGTGRATLEAVEWCIAHGNCGPRTRATLVAVRALLQGANHAE